MRHLPLIDATCQVEQGPRRFYLFGWKESRKIQILTFRVS